jgi:hypothetical protein
MKNLSPLQKKYEVATLQNWIAEQQYNRIEFLVNSYLTEAAPVSGTTPAQQAQPQNIQQAVQQVPKQQLPSLIDQLVGQIAKTNPQAFAELQAAVQSNNINAINQIIKKYSAQAPVKETTIEEVIIDECVKYAYANKDFVTIQKLREFVQSDGDTRIITDHINNSCSPDVIIEAYQELYSEGVGDYLISNIGKGIKTVGKGIASGLGDMFGRLGKFVGKYGPWSALGYALAGPAGSAVVPLVKAALNRWSGSVGSTAAAATDKDKKTDTTTPQQVQQPIQQDKKPAQQQPVQPAQQQPVQPAQQEPVQPAQQQPVQPAQQEPVQPAQQEPVQPVQPAQQANVNVVPPDTTVATVPTTAPTEPPVVDIDAKDVTPGPTATPVSSAAVVPATDTRIRRARPMKTVTPTEPPRTINEFQSAFQKAINEFKRSSAESPIEKANRK